MYYVGDAILVGRSTFKSNNEDRYKYEFLVGYEEKDGFLVNAELRTYISEVELLPKTATLFSKIKVNVRMDVRYEKGSDGKPRRVDRPVYSIVSQVKE